MKEQMDKIILKDKDLNDVINKLGPTDIKRTLHTVKAEYIFALSTQGAFTKINHMLGSVCKFQRVETIQSSIFFEYSRIKLEINNKKITVKS